MFFVYFCVVTTLNLMKSVSLLSFAALSIIVAGLVSSCSKDSDGTITPPVPDVPVAKKLEIKISPSVQDSRATDYGFENGDCIGLYVVNYTGGTAGSLADRGNHVDNMRFTYNGQWTPDTPVYWLDNETHADFYLYYPYADVNSVSAYNFAVNKDQSTETAYKASDFMVGKTTNVSPTAIATVIPPSHTLSRIVVKLEPGNGFTKQSIASSAISVKINGVKCGSVIDIAKGTATPSGDATSVSPWRDGDSYKAIIVPQTVDECKLITVTVDGREFSLKKSFTFESAKSHKFTVVLNKTSNGVNVNINPWNEDDVDNGGTAE